MENRFSFRMGNIELRSCNKNLLQAGEHDRAEIIRWRTDLKGNNSCVAIAVFRPKSEGYDLSFVGEGPLDKTVDWFDLRKLIEYGYEMLKEYGE
jgi:hypothetical protein